MFFNKHFRRIRVGPGVAAALLVLAAMATLTGPAQAEINDTQWSLLISEREMAFRPATDMMAMKSLMWDMPFSRMIARNMPHIALTNESATANVTQFRMTIGDDQFHFSDSFMGMFAELGDESPTNINLASAAENNGNTLVVNFLDGGLDPGDTVHFRIDLGVDAEFADVYFMYPDYRTVLFDMNGDNLYQNAAIVHEVSSADNAKVSVKFEMAEMPSVTAGPIPFEDPIVSDGSSEFVGGITARYGQNDPVRAYSLSGGVVPEPGSAVLALCSVIGSLLPMRLRRRKTAHWGPSA